MEVYFNRMQREVCAIDAHTNVIVAGRVVRVRVCCMRGLTCATFNKCHAVLPHL